MQGPVRPRKPLASPCTIVDLTPLRELVGDGLEIGVIEDQGLGGRGLFRRAFEEEHRPQLHLGARMAQVQHRERLFLRRAAEHKLFDLSGVAEEVEREVKDVGEEIGDGAVGMSLPQHVERGEAALLGGVVPMLDAPIATEHGVEETGDIARGVDVGVVGLQVLIDQDAILDLDPAIGEKPALRADPNTHRDEV